MTQAAFLSKGEYVAGEILNVQISNAARWEALSHILEITSIVKQVFLRDMGWYSEINLFEKNILRDIVFYLLDELG
jgi:hypothetical protein